MDSPYARVAPEKSAPPRPATEIINMRTTRGVVAMSRSRADYLVPGRKFLGWTIVKYRMYKSLCRCGCGKECLVDNTNIGRSKCCMSCARQGNRQARKFCKDLEYQEYRRFSILVNNAIARCSDLSPEGYGGRGICVCQYWLGDKDAFIRYLMGLPNSDDPSLILDRIDNDGHYEPGNLRFATTKLSSQNRRLGYGRLLSHGRDGRFVPKDSTRSALIA
jgi:hypothetical protein